MYHLFSSKRAGFSMLELVFVIVILGIVSSIGAEIIAKVYQSYVIQRATYRSTLKIELASSQIANRLTYAIPNTEIARRTDGVFQALDSLPDNNFTILEWVGYDADSFMTQDSATNMRSGWSGFADIQASTINRLSTPGSFLSTIRYIIPTLSRLPSGVSSATISSSAIFFPGTYTAQNVGYNGNNTGLSLVAGQGGLELFNLTPLPAGSTRTIKEQYKLAWSAYAIVPTPNAQHPTLWDLNLYYNYQPWLGQNYLNGQNSFILKNVSVFQFSSAGNTIRFKICQREFITATDGITTCKEKAVIR